ncbi:MAG: hypothetical protein RL693_429 [Verrucomicrobiota bacterium]
MELIGSGLGLTRRRRAGLSAPIATTTPHGRTLTAAAATTTAGGTVLFPTAIAFAIKKLHHFTNHTETAALLSGLLVLPGIHLESAFDENGAALGEILAGEFGEPCPENHIDISDFFTFLSVVSRVNPIHRNGEIGDGAAFRSITDFRVTGEIPHEHYFIVGGHSAAKLEGPMPFGHKRF